MTQIEANFEAALSTLKSAQRAFDRSRSMKNRKALIAANETFDVAAQAARDEQDEIQKAFLRAERIAAIAPRIAARAAQTDLFA